MKIRLALLLTFSLFSYKVVAQSKNTVAPVPVNITIDIDKKYAPISRLIYGQFIELLFNYFEGGLWAEMIGDRKFFYPVNYSEILVPVNTRNYLGRWKPIGDNKFIVMDSVNVFTGEHSPKINVEPTILHGIQQQGFSLTKGKKYQGYIFLSAMPGISISLSLYKNQKKENADVIILKNITSAYKKYPFTFIAKEDTENAMLEITGMGNGSFNIGAIS